MLLKSGKQWFPTEESIQNWQNAYKNINIENELAKMVCWLEANPGKRKTERGMNRFINSWLNRANNNQSQKSNTSTRNTSIYEDLTDTSWAR